MSTTPDREAMLKEGNEAVRRTLQAVIRYRRFTARDLAAITEVPYNTVQRYTGGHGQLTGGYLEVFAKALRVPRYVLAMDEDEALSWVLAHAPNGSLAGVTHRYPVAITHGLDTDQLTLWSTADIATSVDLRDVSEPARREVVTGTATLSLQGSTAA